MWKNLSFDIKNLLPRDIWRQFKEQTGSEEKIASEHESFLSSHVLYWTTLLIDDVKRTTDRAHSNLGRNMVGRTYWRRLASHIPTYTFYLYS